MTLDLSPGLVAGQSALLISIPHAGTGVPEHIADRLAAPARALPDTDWYVDRLYAWAAARGASLLTARVSRYVVDLNRPPDDVPLYAPAASRLLTGLIPLSTFAGERVYREGMEPGGGEIRERLAQHWRPYHGLLQAELERIRQGHGYAVLLDAHSIRSELPLLFEGRLPELNLGSNGGSSAAAGLVERARSCLEASGRTQILDGRFRGGYITRHYGRPTEGVHALQLELAQSAYMQEDPPLWDEARAAGMIAVLQALVAELLEWRPGHA